MLSLGARSQGFAYSRTAVLQWSLCRSITGVAVPGSKPSASMQKRHARLSLVVLSDELVYTLSRTCVAWPFVRNVVLAGGRFRPNSVLSPVAQL